MKLINCEVGENGYEPNVKYQSEPAVCLEIVERLASLPSLTESELNKIKSEVVREFRAATMPKIQGYSNL